MQHQFSKQYDVIVAGAGVAGVAAALEAARGGMRTALIEKSILVGGLATAGLVCIYLPLCDGNGTQVTFGIAEELLHASLKYGPGEVPPGWSALRDGKEQQRYRVVFSPAAFVLALDELLEAAGVDVWLDTLICAAVMRGDRVRGLAVENKSGRGALLAACVVDATGDADVAHFAGAPCPEADNWLSLWALGVSLERAEQAVSNGRGDALLEIRFAGGGSNGEQQPRGMPKLRGTDGKSVTTYAVASRRLLREQYHALQARAPAGRHNAYPITLPSMAQFRTTRRIAGRTTMRAGQHGMRRRDSIGLVADWRKPGFVWEIPYAALLPRAVKGLLAAGRCISSRGDAWEVTRVIPAAALSGQAAGAAAVLAVKHRCTPDALDARLVQAHLAAKAIPLHLAELGL